MKERKAEEQAILDNIIACMKYKELDQKDLCDYLQVSQQMFTNWKNGSSDSFLKRLNKIAEFLDVTPNDLMSDPAVSTHSPLEGQLLQYFALCDASRQLRIIQFAMNQFDESQKEKTDSSTESAG